MTEQIKNEAINEDNEITYGREIVVYINDKPVKVKKLGLLTYAKMTGSLKSLITSVLEIVEMDQPLLSLNKVTEDDENIPPDDKIGAFAEIIASLVEKNIEQVIALLDIAVPELGREYIGNEVGLDDTLVLLDAIIKVNNITKVVSDGKKFIQSLMGTPEMD